MLGVLLKFSVVFLPLVALGLGGCWIANHYSGVIYVVGILLAVMGFGLAALSLFILVTGFSRIHGGATDALELSDRCAEEFARTGKMPNPEEVMQQIRDERRGK